MKKITIINAISDDKHQDFEERLQKFQVQYNDTHNIDCYTVRNMNINYCCGCWNCWLKTPGECVFKDDMVPILKSIINSDLVIFVTPVVMGFVSSYLKKANDRMIPLIHSYMGIFNNEFHHHKRYKKYPKLGLLLIDDLNSSNSSDIYNNEEYKIITDIYKRMSINLKTEFQFSLISNVPEVLSNEIAHI